MPPPTRSDHPVSDPAVWVRSCTTCGETDLTAAAGQAALLDQGWWRCDGCGGRSWAPVRAPFPGSDAGACPFARSDR